MKPGLKPGLAAVALAALLLTTAAAVSAAYWLLDRKLVTASPVRAPYPSEAMMPGIVTLPVSEAISEPVLEPVLAIVSRFSK
jgi:hypothetical protein